MDAAKGLKVLHCIDSAGFYGAERIVLHLMTEQAILGAHPILGSICRRGDSEKAIDSAAQARGLEVVRFPLRWGPDFIGGRGILRSAERMGCDIIHTHGYKANITLGMLPKSRRQIPLVTTEHGWTSTAGFSKNAVYEWLDRRVLRRFDRVVVVSAAMLSTMALTSMDQGRVSVIPNGIPASESGDEGSVDETAIRSFLARPGFILGGVGRLSSEKGHRFLLSAVKRLLDRGRDISLIVFGEGPERMALEEQAAASGLREKILLPGYCDTVAAFLPSLQAFVLPSLTEGMPVTVLEAMRAGVPVVASRVGGLPEMIRDGESGFLFEPCNVDALTEALDQLIMNPEVRTEVATRARVRMLEEFSSRSMALRYNRLYEEVLARVH